MTKTVLGVTMKIRTIVTVLLMLWAPASLSAQIAEGDRLYDKRAEGHQGARARAETIDAAIAAYQKATAASPEDLEPRVKLLASIRFKGAYVARGKEDKKRIFGQGRDVSTQALALLEKELAERGIASSSKASANQLAAAARVIPHAADLFYWDSVLWGEWALAYGKMAAAREGAADRIRRSATIANLANPKLEGGGGARVLGRLHDQTPRIPFVTGWVSNKQAVRFLRESSAVDPRVKITKVFLAEALVAGDGKRKREAIALLKEVISSPIAPDHLVEDLAAQDDARALLKQWGSK